MLLTLIAGSGIKAIKGGLDLGLNVLKFGEERIHRSVEREYFRNDYTVKRTDSYLRFMSDEDRNQISMNNVKDEIGQREAINRLYNWNIKR